MFCWSHYYAYSEHLQLTSGPLIHTCWMTKVTVTGHPWHSNCFHGYNFTPQSLQRSKLRTQSGLAFCIKIISLESHLKLQNGAWKTHRPQQSHLSQQVLVKKILTRVWYEGDWNLPPPPHPQGIIRNHAIVQFVAIANWETLAVIIILQLRQDCEI